jgi:hypothetical protein
MVTARQRLVWAAIFGFGVTATILFRRSVDLSPIITWGMWFTCFAVAIGFFGVSAWNHRGTSRGRLAAFAVGFCLLICIGNPFLQFLADPEPLLTSLYQIFAVTAGRHDVAFLHFVMAATILGILAWLIWCLRRLRVKQPLAKQTTMTIGMRDVWAIVLCAFGGFLLVYLFLPEKATAKAVLVALALGVPGGAGGGTLGLILARFIEIRDTSNDSDGNNANHIHSNS